MRQVFRVVQTRCGTRRHANRTTVLGVDPLNQALIAQGFEV